MMTLYKNNSFYDHYYEKCLFFDDTFVQCLNVHIDNAVKPNDGWTLFHYRKSFLSDQASVHYPHQSIHYYSNLHDVFNENLDVITTKFYFSAQKLPLIVLFCKK